MEGAGGEPYDGKLSRTVRRAGKIPLTLLYLLSTIYRNSELATNGGITYFLLGGLSSCFILFGISLIYANSGTTNLDGLYIITSLSDMSNGLTNNVSSIDKSDYINYSLLILSVGFLFKISAAPFHF